MTLSVPTLHITTSGLPSSHHFILRSTCDSCVCTTEADNEEGAGNGLQVGQVGRVLAQRIVGNTPVSPARINYKYVDG